MSNVKRLYQYGKGGTGDITGNTARGQIYKAIVRGETFVSGNLRGERYTWVSNSTGRLPEEWRHRFMYDNPGYVIYSYYTPIAWYVDDEDKGEYWVVPDEKYSLTTSRHQGIVRVALSLASKVYETLDELDA